MYIDVDYNPTPSNMFFVSVGLDDKEALSFDFTFKGQRVIKQVLIEKKETTNSPALEKPTGEWDVMELKDGKLLNKRHVKWVDKGSIDEVNGEVWETKWSKPLSDEIRDKLLFWSQFVSNNHEHLDDYQKEMRDFESLLKEYIQKYQ